MTRAAQFGRGTFTYIGDVREVKAKMTALFRKLEQPALTDITVDWPAGADVWPKVMPDLYAGEPVVVTAQYNVSAVTGNVALAGRRAGAMWGTLLPVTDQVPHAGVGVLWARAKISSLMDAGRNGTPEEQIRAAVLDVALTHHLVSKYTSLVAVDVTPTKPLGVNGIMSAINGNVPEGLTGFDQLPRTATSMELQLLLGALVLMAAAVMVRQARVRGWMAAAAFVACATMALPDDASAQDVVNGDSVGSAMILMPGSYNDVGSWSFDLTTVPVDGWMVLEKGTRKAMLTRARVDASGRPDFIVQVGGNNSWAVYLLLSSKAQPGMNAPVAALHGTGC